MQEDPNAAGQCVLDVPRYHGAGWSPRVGEFDLEARFGDGSNLYSYLGSNPASGVDPLGLFFYGIGPTDTVDLGFRLGRAAYDMIDRYAGDLDAYSAWAGDWSLPDDLFDERTAARAAEEAGGDEELGEPYSAVRVKEIQTALRLGRVAGRLRTGAVYPTYYAARYAIGKSGRTLQAHHIVEVRVLKALGLDPNGPAVVLTKAQHLVVTNKLRKAIPYGTELGERGLNKAQIIDKYREAYSSFPELLEEVLKALK